MLRIKNKQLEYTHIRALQKRVGGGGGLDGGNSSNLCFPIKDMFTEN